MRVVITGGAGFIGSALCRHLVAREDWHILNIDALTYASNLASVDPIANRPNYHFLHADICDREAMEAAFARFRPQAVVHLAAESHVDRSITGSDPFIQTNIVGTHTLLSVARTWWETLKSDDKETFRFLHVSTDEVYGSLGKTGFFEETTAYNPSSPYSASKAASDHLVLAWHRTYGFPGIISNCSNNYGPCQFPEKLIPLMILNALEGEPLPVYGNGTHVRDWLFVDDHVRALSCILTAGRPGETYNVGGRSERTNLQVVQAICATLDGLVPGIRPYSELITHVADRPGHDLRYAINAGKLETELGWSARETFDSGLVKTIRWYLDNEVWWRPLRDRVYQGDRLGLPETSQSAMGRIGQIT